MKIRLIILVIASAFWMINLESQAQEKFNLGYKFEKGKTYRFTQDNIIESIQEISGQEMKFNTNMHFVLKYEVEDVSSEGMMTLVYNYDEYKLQNKGMGRDTTMDMKNMLTKKTRAEITKYGKIIRETSTDTAKTSKRLMSLNLTGNTNLAMLPEQAVGIGDKWPMISSDTNTSEESQMIYKRNMECSLVGKDNNGNHDCLKINYKGTLEITGKMKQMGMDMVMEGSGEVSGTLWFDPTSGITVENQSNTSLEMTVTLTGQAQMTIPMSQKMSSTQKLKE